MNSYIDELFKTGKYGDNYVISVPIKLITNKYPIFDELWSQFKGMCNYGTNQQNQVELINKIIDNDKYLTTFRKDVMKYPDKEMYNSFELNSTIKDKTVKIFTLPYNDVWRVTNGKYQHLVNNVSFPSYYWSKDKLQILTDLGAVGLLMVFSFFIFLIYKSLLINNTTINPFLFVFIGEILPFKSTGSFFTTSNSTYIFLLIAVIISISAKKDLN